MIHRVARALAGLAIASLAVAARAEEWIELSAAEQYRIIDNGKTYPLRIPAIVRPPATVADVRFDVFGLRRDNAIVAGLDAAFVVDSNLDTSRGIPALKITVDTSRAERAGMYELVVIARGKPGDNAPEPRTFKIAFEHPEATLRPPATVQIERVLPAPWSGQAQTQSTELTLELMSDLSRLSKPTIGAMQITNPMDKAFTGTVALAREFDAVTFGKSDARTFTASGKFPLGATELASVVRAPQLKSDVPFSVRVFTRLTYWWIWIAGGFGLLAGWCVKVGLVRYIERRRARLEALAVVREIDAAAQTHPDTAFVAKIAPWKQELDRGTIDPVDAVKLSESAKRIQGQLVEARDALIARKDAAKKLLAEWRGVLETQRQLPASVSEKIATAREALGQVDKTINSDIVAAESAQKAAVRALAEAVNSAETTWREEVRSRLDLLSTDPIALPAKTAEQVKRLANAYATQLDSLRLQFADLVPTALDEHFRAIDTFRRQLSAAFGGSIPEALQALAGAVHDFLTRAPGYAEPGLGRIVDTAGAAAAGVHAADTPEHTLRMFLPGGSPELLALDEVFAELFEGAALPNGNPQQNALDTFRTERKYYEAAQLVFTERRAAAKAAAAAKGGPAREPAARDVKPAPNPDVVVAAVDPAAAALSRGVEASRAAAARVRISEASTKWELRIAQAVQTLVFGGAALGVAFLTYRKNFAGTVDELAAIFAFTFGVDFTTDRIVALIKTRESVS